MNSFRFHRFKKRAKPILFAILFWILSCSWGVLMTLFGAIVALGLLLTGHRPHCFHCLIYFETGENWGGFEAGGFFVVNKEASERLKCHEAGHGIQNIMFGPFMPFLVSIPSCVRYWVRRYKLKKRRGDMLPPYDSIWFEGSATSLGEKFFGKK